jgi:hypothetical protein
MKIMKQRTSIELVENKLPEFIRGIATAKDNVSIKNFYYCRSWER